MLIEMMNEYVTENKSNQVTSDKLFAARKYTDSDGNWIFNEDGLFSNRIFGKFDECICKKTKWPEEYCHNCKYRVISRKAVPNYYMESNFDILRVNADFSFFGNSKEIAEGLAKYEVFLFHDQPTEFNLKESLADFEDEFILYGKEAFARYEELGVFPKGSVEWWEENTQRRISIPHPIFRPMIRTNRNKYVTGVMNDTLSKMLNNIIRTQSFLQYEEEKLVILNEANSMYKLYQEYLDNMFKYISEGKKSIVQQELISQPITNAIRGVVINDYECPEDTIKIGYEFVSTLWPMLFEKYGEDWEAIQAHLDKYKMKVITNRPPTIGQKSILGMKPLIQSDPRYRFVVGTNPIIFDGLAADTDGDQFLILPLYSDKSNKEIERLLPSKNYIGVNNGKIRNSIPEDLMYVWDEWLPEDKKGKWKGMSKEDIENLDRGDYFEFYQFLGQFVWEYSKIPNIGDFVDYINGDVTENYKKIIEYTDNTEKVDALLNKTSSRYTDEESNKHIKSVNASNNTDIKDAGYFYKKLMSSTDDFTITIDDCGSTGTEYITGEIDENLFEFKIRFSHIVELNKTFTGNYKEFQKAIMGFDKIHIRSILSCEEGKHRKCCSVCAGTYMLNNKDEFQPKDLGIFSTLMITEHATQASLDSMNKGTSENINKMLDKKPSKVFLSWKEVQEFINNLIDDIGNIGVQSRFYELALLSRVRYDENRKAYKVYAIGNVAEYGEDKLGMYLYRKGSYKKFLDLIKTKEFESNSMKSQIMFDIYQNITDVHVDEDILKYRAEDKSKLELDV